MVKCSPEGCEFVKDDPCLFIDESDCLNASVIMVSKLLELFTHD